MAIPASSTTLAQGTLPVVDSSAATFNFHDHAVRIVMRDGEPWFVATDVCTALGYINPSKAVADHLDDDERSTITNSESRNGGGKLTIINESGLYALVLRSRKPEARKFAKWVTGEVLPSIRKTGGYGKEQKNKPSTDPERIKLAQSLATEAASTVSSEVSRAVFNEAVATGNSRHGSWKINRWILSFEYDEETKDYTRPVVRAEVERTPEELIELWLAPNAHIFDTEFLGRLQQTCAARIFRAYEYQKARATGKTIKPSWGIPLAPSVKSSIGA